MKHVISAVAAVLVIAAGFYLGDVLITKYPPKVG